MHATLPPFSLRDSAASAHVFPSGRNALLCFVKEDCPTCTLTLPLIETAHRSFGDTIDIWAVAQDDA